MGLDALSGTEGARREVGRRGEQQWSGPLEHVLTRLGQHQQHCCSSEALGAVERMKAGQTQPFAGRQNRLVQGKPRLDRSHVP